MNFVFDFGAVVCTWQPDLILAERFPARASSPTLAKALAADLFHHADWQAFDQGILSAHEVVQRSAQRLELDGPRLAQLVADIPEFLTPIPGTLQVLEELQKSRGGVGNTGKFGDVRLYFLSNMPAPIARVLEQRHAFLRWFDGGLFSADVLLIKPQPEIFHMMQARFHLDPAQTLFIDDLQANVDAAQACGWQALRFESPEQLQMHVKNR